MNRGRGDGQSTGPAPLPTARPAAARFETGCDLCEAARFTHWYHEDDVCWVADCEVCDCPMVVWRHHGTDPAETDLAHMLDRLARAGVERFGDGGFKIDRVMRQIPDHFHSHARDGNWHARRWSSRPSRYTGVGGERATT